MVNRSWQRTQNYVAHFGLVLFAGIPFFFFETQLSSQLKFIFIILCYLIAIPLVRFLHKRYARTFVKVFVCDYETATLVIQRVLKTQKLPFSKRTKENQIVFQIRPGKMLLEVDAFVLNMMVDDHLTSEIATKLTLQMETADNAQQMQTLRTVLDEAFAIL